LRLRLELDLAERTERLDCHYERAVDGSAARARGQVGLDAPPPEGAKLAIHVL
jgi:hypothetical protein